MASLPFRNVMNDVLSAIPFPPLNPTAFQVGPVSVRWYGFAYLAGFAVAFVLLRRMAKTGQLRVPVASVGDLLTALVVGVLAGGRLGWWLVYARPPGDGVTPWYEVFAIWRGGMSFHGGLVGVTLALAVWSRRSGARFWNVADRLTLVVPIGLFFGRLANFVNAELVGRVTNFPWGVVFPGEVLARQPSQLYEAVLEGPLLGLLMWWLARHGSRPDGVLSAWFAIFYGVFRFVVEFAREPDEQLGFIAFGWLTMGQALSVALVAVGMLAAVRLGLKAGATRAAAVDHGELPGQSNHAGFRRNPA